MVFTASHSNYANKIIDHLDPKKILIQHRLFREDCLYLNEGIYMKDLRILANRNIEDVAIIDNACYSFGYHLNNGIPIIPFYDNKKDDELKNIVPYIKKFIDGDIREINKKTFKLELLTNANNVSQAEKLMNFN